MSDNTPSRPSTPDEPTSPADAVDATGAPVEPAAAEPREGDVRAEPPLVVDGSEAAAESAMAPATPAALIEPEPERTAVPDGSAMSPMDAAEAPAEPTLASPATPTDVVVSPAEPTSASDAPTVVAPAAAAAPAAAPAMATASPAEPQVRTVYVQAPMPPKDRGNRGLAVLIAVLATIVFAAAYLAAMWLVSVTTIANLGADVQFRIGEFLLNPVFLVPVAIFFIATLLWGLIVNRAAWWAWVLGSLLIAVIVYFGSYWIIALMLRGQLGDASAIDGFNELFLVLVAVPLIVATLLAREVSLWFGGILARRGRTLNARNAEARANFEREQAEARAEREQLY